MKIFDYILLKINKRKRTYYAIVLTILASICYSLMNFCAKIIPLDTTEFITVFIRFSVSLSWIFVVLSYKNFKKQPVVLKTRQWLMHLVRATSSFICMTSLYFVLKRAPISNVTSLAMSYTLFVPILNFIFFRTKTGINSILFLILGFTGVFFVLKPFSNEYDPITLIAIISGFTMALSLLGVHELAKEEHHHTIMLYYFSICFIFGGISSIFCWRTPTFSTLLILICSGIFGTLYHELLTRAMSYESPKTISPALYFSIIMSGMLDWLYWNNTPDLYFWIGSMLITIGCIFSIKYTD